MSQETFTSMEIISLSAGVSCGVLMLSMAFVCCYNFWRYNFPRVEERIAIAQAYENIFNLRDNAAGRLLPADDDNVPAEQAAEIQMIEP